MRVLTNTEATEVTGAAMISPLITAGAIGFATGAIFGGLGLGTYYYVIENLYGTPEPEPPATNARNNGGIRF